MASLGLGSGMPGGSHHRDVLDADPETTESKLRLVEELKSRGRVAVRTKNYPDAEALYGKGVDVLSTLLDDGGGAAAAGRSDRVKRDAAVMRSNRSLARLHMGRTRGAREDALAATELDPAYVKGYWRLGQACSAMDLHDEALGAYEGALGADSRGDGRSSEALRREADKVRARLERERLPTEDGPAAPAAAPKPKKTKKSSDPLPADTPEPTTDPTSDRALEADGGTGGGDGGDDDDDDDAGFTKSDHVRGYKVVGGKKTSYFHRELSEEERRLIGDIAPKPLSDPAAAAAAAATSDGPAPAEGASAWNRAGTWEERDVTKWAADTLTASLTGVKFTLPASASPYGGGVVRVKSAERTDLHGGGHASVAAVRGKKRYIYEFGIRVRWELAVEMDEGEDCSGTMTFPDVDGTVEPGDGYDLSEFGVDGDVGGEARRVLNEHVREGGFRDAIHGAIDGWVRLFRATY